MRFGPQLAFAALVAITVTVTVMSLGGGRSDEARIRHGSPLAESTSKPDAPSPLPTPSAQSPSRTDERAGASDSRGARITIDARADGTGEPIEGAVAWVTRPEVDVSERFLDAEWIRANGTQIERDTSGQLSFAAPTEDGLLLVCDHETVPARLAIVRIGPDRVSTRAPLRVDLASERAARVRVRDPAGRPAPGVALVLTGVRGETLWRGVSPMPGAEVAVPHLQCIPRTSMRLDACELSAVLPLFGSSALVPRVAVPALTPDEPAMLVLPPNGSVQLVARIADGARFEHAVRYWIGVEGKQRTELVAEDGTLNVPFVPTGARLEITALPADGSAKSVTRLEPGPARDGETAVIDVALSADPSQASSSRACEFVVQVLTADGSKFVPERIDARIDRKGLALIAQARVERDGTLIVTLSEFVDPREQARLLLRFPNANGLDSGSANVTGLVVPGRHALDPIRLDPVCDWVAGRVLDEAGRSLPECTVTARSSNVFVRGLASPRDQPKTTTDPSGEFRIRAPVPGFELTRLSFTPSDARLVCDGTDVKVGATDVIAIARPRVRVRGRVLVDEEVPIHLLEVRAESGARIDRAMMDPDGKFMFEPAVAGNAHLYIQSSLERAPIVTLSDAEFAPGVTLEPFDLRGRLHAVRLHVIDIAGAPCFAARLWPAENVQCQVAISKDGIALLVASDRPLEMRAALTDPSVTTVNQFGIVTIQPDQREAWLRLKK